MINSRRLDDLLPLVRDKARAFIAACALEGVDVLITSTYRDGESQDALYAQGRSRPGRIVTMAKAGQSFHQYRVAFDFVPLVNGKPNWDDTALFTKCGRLAVDLCGLEWAGNWARFRELPHCQFTGGLTLADFQAGKTIGG